MAYPDPPRTEHPARTYNWRKQIYLELRKSTPVTPSFHPQYEQKTMDHQDHDENKQQEREISAAETLSKWLNHRTHKGTHWNVFLNYETDAIKIAQDVIFTIKTL